MPCEDNVTEHIKHLANVTHDDPAPETTEEAIAALEKLLTDEDKAFLDNAKDFEEAAVQLHHSLGRFLRNSWGLWKGSRLNDHLFATQGIEHPDDMSHYLIVEYCRRHIKSVWERLDED